MRVVERLSAGSYDECALAVSWVSLFFATWGVVRLAWAVFPSGSPARAGWLLCWFPASVFLLAGYAESTYIALFAWRWWRSRSAGPGWQRWPPALPA